MSLLFPNAVPLLAFLNLFIVIDMGAFELGSVCSFFRFLDNGAV